MRKDPSPSSQGTTRGWFLAPVQVGGQAFAPDFLLQLDDRVEQRL